MIIIGHGFNTIPLGQRGTEYCPTCEKERSFSLVLHYEYNEVYWLGWTAWRRYYHLCDVCQKGPQLDRKEVEASLGHVPLPFRHRYGCLLLMILFAAFMVVFVLGMILTEHGKPVRNPRW